MKKDFAVNPSVSISRSKFNRPSRHAFTCNLGELVPVYCDEVLPGDTRSINLSSIIRMSNPIYPIMDHIWMDYYAFFVPLRLCWENAKFFFGENTNGAGAISKVNEKSIPKCDLYYGCPVGSVGHHLGLPVVSQDGNKACGVSVLPLRAYKLIYNRWFRDQNLIAPVYVRTSDHNITETDANDSYTLMPYKVAKISDYFTRALPYAQKGDPVSLGLFTGVPSIKADGAMTFTYDDEENHNVYGPQSAYINSLYTIDDDAALMTGMNNEQVPDEYYAKQVYHSGLKLDLGTQTLLTINRLRFAFQYQKMLEKDALYGTRYWEILHAHFGINAPDASLQDPEFLGSYRVDINIDQVVQTTGLDQVTPSQNELGQVGGNSVTGISNANLFQKSFCEHGILMVIGVCRHDQSYSQGVPRMFSRSKRTDFYWPVFANLGNQEILNKEIFVQGTQGATTDTDNEVFGYQEAWAEYRYKPNSVSGLVDPAVANSLGYITLANNFGSLPTLGQTFIEQDRNALARCLSTGITGPDFVVDCFFNEVAVRAMPMYSIPGLIDHH